MTICIKHKTRKRALTPTRDHAQDTFKRRTNGGYHPLSTEEDHILRLFVNHTDQTFHKECSTYALVKNAMYSMLSNRDSRKKAHAVKVLRNLLQSPTRVSVGMRKDSDDNLECLVKWIINEAAAIVEKGHADQANLFDTATRLIDCFEEYQRVFLDTYIPEFPIDEQVLKAIQALSCSIGDFIKEYFLCKLVL